MNDDLRDAEKLVADKLRDGGKAIAGKGREAERTAADKVRDAGASVGSKALEAERAIADKIHQGRTAASDMMDELRKDSTEPRGDLAETTRTAISENPWIATACAFGAGLLVGFFLRRD